MKFSELAKYLQKLEDTTKRLEITSILADLIRALNAKEIDHGIYLSLGYLQAEFESEKFNIAEKMMIKILALAYNTEEDKIKTKSSSKGDLGTVAEGLAAKKTLGMSINEVHRELTEIAKLEGSGSQEKKISTSAELLRKADPISAKYLVRTILGTTRLGFTELTVVDALVEFLNGAKDKELKKEIEDKYRIHPDIGLVCQKNKQKGLKGLSDVEMEVGVPVHAQKAQRISGPVELIEKVGEVSLENKFDGTRVQLHMDRNKKMEVDAFEQQNMFGVEKEMTFVKTFTRNLEETTHQFPDLIEAALKQIDAKSVIIDGEAIGYDKKTGKFLNFQETIQRKRKHGVSDFAKQIPLKYIVFDLLHLNGKSLVDKPLADRQKALDSIIKKGTVIEIAPREQTDDPKDVAKFHKKALKQGFEGIMAKRSPASLASVYQPGARNFTWVKMKKTEEQILSDTVDCVILGYYHGRGARAKFGIGGFLVALWDRNEDIYKTLSKVGSGLKDDDWVKLKKMADKIATKNATKNAEIDKKYNCDVWVTPKIVVEIAADELSKSKDHSAGYALRFPRLIRIKSDRKPTQTTTIEEVAHMHKIQ